LTRVYDAIVVGLGAMGSAATYQLAKAGASVLGIDRYDPPHDRGSSHGETRITRLAIGEGAHYVPLVKRSHELWHEIEAETGETLMTQTGMLLIGARTAARLHGADDFLATTVAAAHAHDIEHELLDAATTRKRFPQFALTGDERGAYYEPSAGFVRPERAVAAQLELATRHGATLRTNERVLAVDGGVVRTERDRFQADRVVLAAGPWVGELAGGDFTVHRQVQFWFEAPPELEGVPIFVWELGGGPDDFFYGFPPIDGAIKVAAEDYATTTTPETCERTVAPEEALRFRERYLDGRLQGVGRCMRASTCLYTVTPDREFVIEDRDDRTLLVSACSGHGFKHSAAIGERIAQRVAKKG
jgi:sarcosine oxidase